MAHRLARGLRGAVKNIVFQQQIKPSNHFLKSPIRNYMSEMRKSAFEGNMLRLIRSEIQYELDHSPPSEPIPEFNTFKVDELPGQQWIRLTKKFRQSEDIKIEVTMFDGAFPMKKDDDNPENMKPHITFIVDVFKGEGTDILEFICSAWPDSIEIRNVFTRGHNRISDYHYMGPGFKELDDELQTSLYDYLETRGVDDKLAEFLHRYMINKDKNEYLRWMEKMKSFIEKK
ncbi:hypothetical protein ACP275_09G096100 [Erythranthe tilingii]